MKKLILIIFIFCFQTVPSIINQVFENNNKVEQKIDRLDFETLYTKENFDKKTK